MGDSSSPSVNQRSHNFRLPTKRLAGIKLLKSNLYYTELNRSVPLMPNARLLLSDDILDEKLCPHG